MKDVTTALSSERPVRSWWIALALAALVAAPLAACSDDTGGPGDGQAGTELDDGPPVDLDQPVDDGVVDDLPPVDTADEGGEEVVDEPPIDEPDDPVVIEQPDEVEEDQPLTLLKIDPDKGTASGGDQVILEGTGFESNLLVFFDESPALDTFVLDSENMVAVTPPRVPGLVDVRLINPDTGESTTLESGYLFFNPVQVVAIDPPNGHVLGGEPVTVTGSGFVEGSQVLIGGRSAIDVQVIDDATIFAITPDAPSAGTYDVHVSGVQGVGTLSDGFTYFQAPEVSGVAPAVGPLAGGNQVEVKGDGFVEPLVVTFGASYLEDVQVVSSELVVGTVPAGAAVGAVDVLAATSYGSGLAGQAYTYLEDFEPGDDVEILAVTPPSGPSEGGQLITVVAKGLTDEADTKLYIGAELATIKGVDAEGHVILAEVPAGPEGSVAVTLNNSNGTDTLANGYTYEAFVKVYEVAPNFGPIDGGTAITVTGVGFAAGLQLRVGALPAASVEVVDEHTITAVTPPGSPGLANVTVLQGGLQNTLVGGFAYLSEMDLWVVDPAQGSQAGGTWIELAGSGFPTDADVLVGGTKATHVTVVSPTLITARTPPGNIGSVDVTVTSNTKGSVVLPNGYTYYDPESVFGGTWGNEVDGAVNVTVLSGVDGSGIPDAFVMLWTDPSTPYQGYTNQQGQITFSGPELSGEQMVSASKPGFASNSVVEYDAQNITLYLIPNPPPSSGPPPPGQPPPVFNGQVVNATKYVPVPWGQCTNKLDAPGTLCDPCTTDAECGGTMNCSEIPLQTGLQSTFCTTHCVNSLDCPDGFMCMPLNGVEEPQCVPSAGIVTAFCDFTKGTIFSEDYIPNPGQQVLPDFSFQMVVPVGEFAMYCWGGIQDPDTLSFTPYALGVKRHVFALPGDVIDEKITLNHPLNGELQIRLDDPPSNATGPNYNFAIIHIDLGSDGVFEMLDHPQGFTDTLTMPRIMKGLTGDLYDASYTIMAGAFTIDAGFLSVPYSVTLHKDITQTVDDTFYVYDANGWEVKSTGITKNINDLEAKAAGSVLGVGSDGLIVHSVGNAWAQQESGTDLHLYGLDALETNEAIAVGQAGIATHFDGFAWNVMPTPTGWDLQDVYMVSPTEAYAVGYYVVLKWDGVSWTMMTGNTSKNLQAVHGFAADDVWAVGNTGGIIHYDGTSWVNVPSGTMINLKDVWGPAPDDVYFVGEAGLVLHWDGVEIQPIPTNLPQVTFEGIFGYGSDDFVVVGTKGTVLRWDGTQWLDESPPNYNNSFLAVTGADGQLVTSGTHELLLGPLLQVPENIDPSDGGTMGEDYRISWDVKPGPDPHFSYVVVSMPGLMGPVAEWIVVNDFNVTELLLPDFPNIEGTPGISSGPKILTLWRVYKEGFDIDNYSYQDFGQLRWNSWAVDETTFTKL